MVQSTSTEAISSFLFCLDQRNISAKSVSGCGSYNSLLFITRLLPESNINKNPAISHTARKVAIYLGSLPCIPTYAKAAALLKAFYKLAPVFTQLAS
jgi:hypothetical protein